MVLLQAITEVVSKPNAVEDLKNILTIVGIILTIIFGIFTVVQKRHDRLTVLRNKLTDILDKITTINIESAKYNITVNKNDMPGDYIGHLKDQRKFYVDHASYIVQKLPSNWTFSHELNIIAFAFSAVDDNEKAKLYFTKSLARATSVTDIIRSKRNVAGFTFMYIDQREGEKQFEKIFSEFPGDTDVVKDYRGHAYRRWLLLYREVGDIDAFKAKLQLAKLEFQALKNTFIKSENLKRVEDLLAPYKS